MLNLKIFNAKPRVELKKLRINVQIKELQDLINCLTPKEIQELGWTSLLKSFGTSIEIQDLG
jgi:hypothetical protein